MPEGDAVRRTADDLDQALRDTVIHRAELRWPSLATTDLSGWRTLEVCSVGKHLLHRFDSGMTLHSHRRMEGRWTISTPSPPPTNHRVRAVLLAGPAGVTPTAQSGVMAVGWSLGELHLVATSAEHRLIGHLGPDLLDPRWEGREDELVAAVTGAVSAAPQRMVAELLLDQAIVAGLGTIWVSDLLFVHRTNPATPAGEVDDLAVLVHRARTGMQRAVDLRCTTTTPSTRRGQTTWVHGRSGRPCRRCGTAVRLWLTADHNRTIFYCPHCQGGLARGDDGSPQAPLGARRPTR